MRSRHRSRASPAVAVDDGHALIQGVDDLPLPMLVFEPVPVGASTPGRRNTVDGCHRQDFPHPVVDHLDESNSELAPMK